MYIGAIIKAITDYAPPAYQESWDNTGLQVGSTDCECTGVLVCLDVTPEIIDEAIANGCNLVVSHHPLFFKPVKRLTGDTKQTAAAMNAIAAGITIYSSHTAADSTRGGVSALLAEKLGCKAIRVLDPISDSMVHLRVYVPVDHAESLRLALYDAGAGCIDDYDCCSYSSRGEGSFRPKDGAQPYVGKVGEIHTLAETAIDMVLNAADMARVERTLLEVHPYECPAYQFTPMLNKRRNIGLGLMAVNDDGYTAQELIDKVKTRLGCKALRCSWPQGIDERRIRRVAVCGGAGGSLIGQAIAAGAQAYVSGDLKYHDFVDYGDRIMLIDAGHYETEAPIKQKFAEVISARYPDVKVVVTTLDDNPVKVL